MSFMGDTRLGEHISHGAVSWKLRLDIVTQPAYNDHIDLELRGGYIEVDEAGNWQGKKPEDTQWPKCIFIPIELKSGLVERPDEIRREIGVEPPVVSKRKGFPRDEGPMVEIDDGLDDAMREAIAKHTPNTGQIVETSPLAKNQGKLYHELEKTRGEQMTDRLGQVTAEGIMDAEHPNAVTIDKDMSMSVSERERRQAAGSMTTKPDGTLVEDFDSLNDRAAKASQEALDAMGPGKIVKPTPGVDGPASVKPVEETTTSVAEPIEDVEKSKAILAAMEAAGDLPPAMKVVQNREPVQKNEVVKSVKPIAKLKAKIKAKLDLLNEMVDGGAK